MFSSADCHVNVLEVVERLVCDLMTLTVYSVDCFVDLQALMWFTFAGHGLHAADTEVGL